MVNYCSHTTQQPLHMGDLEDSGGRSSECGGHKWMQVDASGCKWMQVDASEILTRRDEQKRI